MARQDQQRADHTLTVPSAELLANSAALLSLPSPNCNKGTSPCRACDNGVTQPAGCVHSQSSSIVHASVLLYSSCFLVFVAGMAVLITCSLLAQELVPNT